MQLGRVIDQVVATIQHPALEGRRLLLVKLVGLDRQSLQKRAPLVAFDPVGAGVGQLVLLCEEGKAAQLILGDKRAPVRTLILGIVDE
ncbi:MAG: EutN/CcmL family microcompartment protein [Armatimonadetes bacterium]|nr:EutN/CcmL family microcompartment protein [Armatimonadota bacterium]